MSAIEPLPSSSPSTDRRNSARIRLDRILTARVGRHDGRLVDLSLHGGRVRHSGTLLRGSLVRLVFDWAGQKFAASAEVLSSRIVMLGTHEGESATYETRMRFVAIDAAASELLARVLRAITSEELRTWVGNLKGFDEEPRPLSVPRANGFIRCRRIGNRWEKKWTRDSAQPKDGFALPAGTDAADVDALCRAWMEMSSDSRQLLQLTAKAVAQEAVG